jgi:hypothetical protein
MNLHSWMGIATAQRAAGSKRLKLTDRRHHVVSTIVGILLAVVAAAGILLLLTNL